jgi:hypothetical protein
VTLLHWNPRKFPYRNRRILRRRKKRKNQLGDGNADAGGIELRTR